LVQRNFRVQGEQIKKFEKKKKMRKRKKEKERKKKYICMKKIYMSMYDIIIK
jgi:hypothetical protein